MNIFKLSLKNLFHRPLSLTLSLLLFALGIGLISLMLNLNQQIQNQIDRNLAGIDLVVGAKGSPMQLVLSNMYHIDNPTGNISVEEATPFMRPGNPLIETAIPLSLGDNYNGFRIVGTTAEIVDLYQAEIDEGKVWEYDFEATIGAEVAQRLNIGLGHEFHGVHGLNKDDDMHVHDYMPPYVVKGILQPTGTVIDQLILVNTATVWMVHHDHDHSHDHEHGEEHDHDHSHSHEHEQDHHHDHDHNEEHQHEHNHSHDHEDNHHGHAHSHNDHHHAHGDDNGHVHGPGCGHHHEIGHSAEDRKGSNSIEFIMEHHGEDITALLLKYRGRNIQTLNLARQINQNTNMQAASPAIEINRLYDMMGSGIEIIQLLGWIIAIVSGISIFISLFQSLSGRKYELALIRVMGSSRSGIFSLIILEGIWIAFFGYAIGILLSKLAMFGVAGIIDSGFRYTIEAFSFVEGDAWLLVAALVIGLVAALIPAVIASRTDISKTLSEK